MEKLPSKDIERMITFIQYEASEKIRELQIRSVQEYNTEKARVIKEESARLEMEYRSKQEKLQKKRVMAKSSLTNAYRIKFLEAKQKVLENIFEKVRVLCTKQKLNQILLDQCLNKMDKDLIIYCMPGDREIVESLGTVKVMMKECLGGVVMCSVDGKTVVDNSYASRIATFRERYGAELSDAIFGRIY